MLSHAPVSFLAVSEAAASQSNSASVSLTLDGVTVAIEATVVAAKAPTVTPAGAPGRWWAIDGKAFYGTRAEAEAIASQQTQAKPVVLGKKPVGAKVKPAPLSLVLEQMEALQLPAFDISLYQGPASDDVAKLIAGLELQTAQMQALRAELDDEDVLLLTI